MPFADYTDFDDCVSKNQDKDDPDAYCATIQRNVEGKSITAFLKSAVKAIEDLFKPKQVHPHGDHVCVCSKCGKEVTVGAGEKCNEQVCPDCGGPMTAKTAGEFRGSSSFTLTKDVDGRLRWFGFVSGNFKDRDKEVFPAEVHQEYVQFLDRTKQYPELWVWHSPGSRFGKADWAEYDHGFLMMSGLVDQGKETTAEAIAAMPDQGMSHGFKFHYREPGVIGFYRTYEVSVLPLSFAAFPWTRIEILNKETSMRPEKRAYLESVLGKDRVAEIETQADALQKSLVAAGVDWKEFDPHPVEALKAEDLLKAFKDTDEYKALAGLPAKLETMTKGQLDVTAIFDASIKALQSENAALKEQIKKSQDELVAATLRPRANVTPASQRKDTVVPDGDPLAEAKPRLPIDSKLAASVGAVFK